MIQLMIFNFYVEPKFKHSTFLFNKMTNLKPTFLKKNNKPKFAGWRIMFMSTVYIIIIIIFMIFIRFQKGKITKKKSNYFRNYLFYYLTILFKSL